jgi:hypothetical protein
MKESWKKSNIAVAESIFCSLSPLVLKKFEKIQEMIER